ncbi:MAG: hypothetical protein K0R18_444 [Bacillales bacterium]|jgi:hypothetical protein|nr:hypothetical protein [Bacillales bacterium]
MEDFTSKILKMLRDEGIQDRDIRANMARIADEIDNQLWEKITISPPLLYNLMDTIWYNLEHIIGGGNAKGLDNLRLMGSKYPTFMYTANNDVYVDFDKTKSLLDELEDILSKWSNEWTFVMLFTKSQEGWNAGKSNPSPVVIYDPNLGESPIKMGYKHNNNSGILDSSGNYMESGIHETVLCAIETKLGTYGREPLMKAALERLIDTCKKSISNKKGVLLDFETYDYTN